MAEIDDSLYDGLEVDQDLVLKATLRVAARPLHHPVTQSLAEEMVAKFKARMGLMMTDIERALGQTSLIKATNAQTKKPKATPKTVDASGERKKTADGYLHVEQPGSRGGKFWRDAKGNVRYGDKPTGGFDKEAHPEHVVEHFKKYIAPNPFAAPAMKDALLESDVLTDTDHGFISWWNDNLDTFLEAMNTNRDELKEAGGWNNMSFVTDDGRRIGFSEAVEMFFQANASLFVGDPVEGGPEPEDEILEAVRGLMSRYQKALTDDPKVQAAAIQIAEKKEAKKNAFFIKAEQSANDFSGLASDLMKIEDKGDLALRFIVAMREMGLIERGSSGRVAKQSQRGAITPVSSLLTQGVVGSLVDNDQLDRLNASQLITLSLAAELQEGFADDNTYHPEPTKFSQQVLTMAANKLGVKTEAMRRVLDEKLAGVANATGETLTSYNEHPDPNVGTLLKMSIKDVSGEDSALDKYKEAVEKVKAERERILKAQEDPSFEVPPTMKDGVWNGKTWKDPNDHSKGVWEPMEYQKKYVNWMKEAERGVIAADAGMGKSPTIVMFREMLAAQGEDVPAICFLPPALMEQWPGVIKRFAPKQADSILNLSGLSLEERKVALQSDLAKKAKYIFISTGTLTGEVPDPDADPADDDGTGGSDNEMVDILKGLNGAVFIDEAHQGGYKKAGNTRHEIAKAVIGDRKYAFGMTATPMPNDPQDVFHLANLFAPDKVGDQDFWAGRTSGVVWDDEKQSYNVSNPQHLADLNNALRPYVFYKCITDPDVVKDMGKGLPERRGVHQDKNMWPNEGDLEMSKKPAANGLAQHDYFKEGGVIDTMVDLRIERLISDRNKKITAGEVNPETGDKYEPYNERMLSLLAGGMKITLQRQASISPALIDPSYKDHKGNPAHSPKIQALCDDIVAHFSNNGQGGKDAKPLVVFSSFPGKAFPLVKQALAARGVDPSLIEQISGDVQPSERGYMQDKLNAGHAKVMLIGTMSGGAGLNLQEAANKTLFLDEPWNPAAKRQAIGRVWRTGQKNTVFEKTYRTGGTYDEMIEQKIAGKATMAHALLSKDLPTSATFNAKEPIEAVLGRSRRFKDQQMKDIEEGSENYDMQSSEHKAAMHAMKEMGDDWSEAAAEGGRGGVGASFTDEHYKPNKDAQKELKKRGAHALTNVFDETEFRGKWAQDRKSRLAKQELGVAQLMVDAYKQRKEPEKAAQYERRIAALKEGAAPKDNEDKAHKQKQDAKKKQAEKKQQEQKQKHPKLNKPSETKKPKEKEKQKPKTKKPEPKKASKKK